MVRGVGGERREWRVAMGSADALGAPEGLGAARCGRGAREVSC